MSTTTSTQNSTAGDLGTGIASALASADATGSQRLENLNLVQQARIARLTRTAANAAAKYGAGSPQANAAEAAVTASKATSARVVMAQQRLATPSPPVAATEWALHGRVFDATLKPLSGYTVFLVDSQNNYANAYGFSYTDGTGYFLLGSTSASQGQGTEQSTAPSQLFVAIVDQAAQPVYRDTTAFAPTLGGATYREIELVAGDKSIGDPPSAIRNVAFPPEASK